MNYVDNEYRNLASCKQIAKACGYDTIICKDGKGSKGAKYFYTGQFRGLCKDMYNTDMYERCFYEVIPSSPIDNPVGHVASTSMLPGEDRGFCGARFVVDVDFSISKDHVPHHLQCLTSVLETAYKIAREDDARPRDRIRAGLKRMKSILTSVFYNDSREETICSFRKVAIKWMRSGLRSLGFSREEVEVHVLDATCVVPASEGTSPKMKFSLHLHFNNILLRQHAVDGAILARTLNAAMAGSVLREFLDDKPKTDDFWIRCILLQVPSELEQENGCRSLSRSLIARMGIIDEAIYSENRVMRIWLSSKKGQDRPFTRVDGKGRCIEGRTVTRDMFIKGMETFRISHVPGKLDENDQFFKGIMLKVQKEFPMIPPTCLVRLRSRRATASPDNTGVNWKLRQLRESDLNSLWDIFKSNETAAVSTTKGSVNSLNRSGIPPVCNRPSSRRVLHSTMTIYSDTGDPVEAGEIVESVFYHCPTCDCHPRNHVVDKGNQSGPPDGNPSARCVVTTDLDLALYCFNCQHLQIVQQIVNYGGFDGSSPTVKISQPIEGRYFPVSEIESICAKSLSGERLPTMIAVNAEMGSGKTHAAKQISILERVERLLVVTHRKSLARALAVKFGAVCYLDFPKDARLLDISRLVICVNSLWRIREAANYDLIIIDEAGFVRRHFAGQTFSKLGDPSIPNTRDNIVAVLSRYMHIAPCILLLQDGLSHDDVQFYSTLRRNDRRVHKFFLPRRTTPGRYKTVEHFYDWLCELHHTVITRKKKTFVACSLAVDAVTLYTFFKECGEDLRIAMITGNQVEPKELKEAETFVHHYREFDICIATSAMETGVSLEGHYTDVFALYRPCPISHSSQIQLVNRVRNSQRTIIFASKGSSFQHRTTVNLLKRAWHTRDSATNNPTNSDGDSMHLDDVLKDALCSALLAKIVEDADAKNNNRQLWALHQNAEVTEEFRFDKRKRARIGNNFYAVASANRKRYKFELREMDIYSMKSDICEEVGPPPSTIQDSELLESSEEVVKRYTEKKLVAASKYIYPYVIRVMQAYQRIGEHKGSHRNLNREKDYTEKAINRERFSRHAFIFFALIDHCAAIEACGGNETKIAEVKKRSYWSAIESWITSRPPTNDEQTQLELQSVLEVLQGAHTVQAMYGTFLPAPGLYMLLSREKVIPVITALERWDPPKEITACAEHTLESSRKACQMDRAAIKMVEEGKQTPSNLAGSIRRFVSGRVPITWKVVKRESINAAIITPWCISTLALVACGMKYSWLPADEEKLNDCDWLFFKNIRSLDKACMEYILPNDYTLKDEENAVQSLEAELNLKRKKFDRAYQMKLKLDGKYFSKIMKDVSHAATNV